MNMAPSSVLALARALLGDVRPASASNPPGALVNDRLRVSLTRLVGADGYTSLLRRSLSLTQAKMPVLQGAWVGADGRVEGLQEVLSHDEAMWREAAVAVTAQLLELLVVFLGEPLTRRIVREVCPEVSSNV